MSLPRPSPSSWSTKNPGAAESISLVCWRGDAVSVSRSTRMSPRPRGEAQVRPCTWTVEAGAGIGADAEAVPAGVETGVAGAIGATVGAADVGGGAGAWNTTTYSTRERIG